MITMLSRAAIVVMAAITLVAPLHADNPVKVEVDGKSFVLDLDSDAVQANLRRANPQAGEVKLPAWLYPSPGQVPVRSNYDARTGIASATFASSGTVDQVIAYYAQLLASKGYTAGQPLGGPKNKIVSGKNRSAVISVNVGVPFRNPVGSEFTVTYAPEQNAANRKHFEAAWFDKSRALLCLRDVASGEEYYLDARGIQEANQNRPGAVKSEGASFPSWFPVYPGAQRTSEKIVMLMEPTAVFRTRDSIAAVYEFYRSALPATGAKVLQQNFTRSGSPSKEFSAAFKVQMGDDVVEVQVGQVYELGFDALKKGGPPDTGIGVRYTVPRR